MRIEQRYNAFCVSPEVLYRRDSNTPAEKAFNFVMVTSITITSFRPPFPIM